MGPLDLQSDTLPTALCGPVNSLTVLDLVVCLLFDLILYIPSTIFKLNRDRSSWVESVLS